MLVKDANAPASPLLKSHVASPLLKPASVIPNPQPAAPPVPQPKRAQMRNFGLIEFKRRVYDYELTADQSVEDALEPTFWTDAVAGVMGYDANNPKGRGDIIKLWKPDTSESATLRIIEIGKGYIKTRLEGRWTEGATKQLPDDARFTTRWNVGRRCHEVVRGDGQVMSGGHQTKDGATEWIAQHLKAMAA